MRKIPMRLKSGMICFGLKNNNNNILKKWNQGFNEKCLISTGMKIDT